MANYETLKSAIQQVVKTNGNNEITGALLQQSLLAMINSLGSGYQYMGVATPTTNPGTPDQKIFYIAIQGGIYSNFNNIQVGDYEIAILKYDTAWSKDQTNIQNGKFNEFVTDCPFVKELYLNADAITADVATLHLYHNVTNNRFLRFSNSARDKFVAETTQYIEDVHNILPIRSLYGTALYGYIIVDWEMMMAMYPMDSQTTGTILKPITGNAQYIDFSPSIKAMLIANNVDSLQIDVQNVRQLVGAGLLDLDLTHSTTNNTDYIWFQYPPFRINKINRIRYVANTGTINFYKITYNEGAATLQYESITSVVNTAAELGTIKTINVDVELAENQFIGVNGAFCFAASNVYYTRNYQISNNMIGERSGQFLFFDAYNSDSLTTRITVLENETIAIHQDIEDIRKEIEQSEERIGEVVLYDSKLNVSNPDIVGTQTFDTFGLLVNGRKVLNKYYAVSDRTIKYVCKFSSNTIAGFAATTNATADATTSNTDVIIDIANKRYNVHNIGWFACDILNSTDVFMVAITKHYQKVVVEITNMYSGQSIKAQYTNNGTGGVGRGAIGTAINIGMQRDYYCVNLQSGSAFSISQIVITCAKCDLLIYGDSISEPEAYWPTNVFAKSWTQLVVKKMNRRALTSGRCGTSISALMERIVNELPFIKPKYVMVTIGTNGGNSVQNLSAMVDYIESQGAVCILNHIPANINSGGVSNTVAVNAIIDQVRAAKNVRGADFDIPTSLAHDGAAVDTTQMWWEDYGGATGSVYHHPNEKGSANMFARLQIDVPEIFE